MRAIFAVAAVLSAVTGAAARDLPNAAQTPGAINPAVTPESMRTTICVPGWTKTIRPPTAYTNNIKKRLMAAARIPWSRRSAYELDHAYPLTLGGAPRDPRNLWLQKWTGRRGAHAKDRLEQELNRRTCRGALRLDQARGLIMPDWISGYRAIFGRHSI